MGSCGCGLVTWIVILMVYNIVQSLTHLVFMILEVLIYHCEDILDSKSKSQNALFLDYFFNNECVSESVDLKPRFTDRTQILAISNITLDLLWLILTTLILSLICAKKRTRLFFWTLVLWVVVATVALSVDIASGVLYIIDLTEATDFSYYFSSINLKFSKDWETTPPLIMLTISSRMYLFLLLNMCSLIGMIVITVKFNKSTLRKSNQRTVPLKPPNKSALKASRPTHLQEDNIPRVEDWYRHYEGAPDVIAHARCADTDSDWTRNYYNHTNMVTGRTSMLGNQPNVMINGVPSGTLRKQLPWSYVHEPGIMPRRQTRRGDGDAPPVPVPDYTLRLHGNPRFDEPKWTQYPSPPPVPPRKPPHRHY